jgi:hypothetical protein
LFDYPFGGVEVQNMRSMTDLITREYGVRPSMSPEGLVGWLQKFHTRLATALHNGEDVLELVPSE